MKRNYPLSFLLLLSAALAAGCDGISGSSSSSSPEGGETPSAGAPTLSYALPEEGIGARFYARIEPTTTGDPTSFSVLRGELPAGLELNPSSGVITGVAFAAGSYDARIRAFNSAGATTYDMTLDVVDAEHARHLFTLQGESSTLSSYLIGEARGRLYAAGFVTTVESPARMALLANAYVAVVGAEPPYRLAVHAFDAVHGRVAPAISSLTLPSRPVDVAVHPSSRRLYVLVEADQIEDRIHSYAFDVATGVLAETSPAYHSARDGGTALAMDPRGRHLHMAHSADGVQSFVVAADGGLSQGANVAAGSAPIDLVVVPEAGHLYVLNAGGPDISRIPLLADGSLGGEGAQAVPLDGERHSELVLSADSLRLYVPGGDGFVRQFIVGASGALSQLPSADASVALAGMAASPAGGAAWAVGREAHLLLAFDANASGELNPDRATPMRTRRAPVQVLTAPGMAPVQVDAVGLYAANRLDGDISQFAVGDDGGLEPLEPARVAAGVAPQQVTAHPFADLLYLVNGADAARSVQTLAVDESEAATEQQAVAVAAGLRDVLVDRNGAHAYTVGSLGVQRWTIESDGSLAPGVLTPIPARAAALHPHGRFLYVAEDVGDTIVQFALDPVSGELRRLGAIPVDTGPAALTVDPTGRFVYCVNSSTGIDRIRGFRIDAAEGSLTELPGSPYTLADGGRRAADVAVHPDGALLLIAVRDSSYAPGVSRLQRFAINLDPESEALGALTALGDDLTLPGAPFDVEFHPDGQCVYVSVDEADGQVAVYGIEADGSFAAESIDVEAAGRSSRGLALRTVIR